MKYDHKPQKHGISGEYGWRRVMLDQIGVRRIAPFVLQLKFLYYQMLPVVGKKILTQHLLES
jgi:hypothetical protein